MCVRGSESVCEGEGWSMCVRGSESVCEGEGWRVCGRGRGEGVRVVYCNTLSCRLCTYMACCVHPARVPGLPQQSRIQPKPSLAIETRTNTVQPHSLMPPIRCINPPSLPLSSLLPSLPSPPSLPLPPTLPPSLPPSLPPPCRRQQGLRSSLLSTRSTLRSRPA